MSDVLQTILVQKREHVANQKAKIKEVSLLRQLNEIAPSRGFLSAIKYQVDLGKNALIAEIKKASPSKGVIRADFDPAALAKAYQEGGATCLSVLTDEPYFQGKDQFVQLARSAVLLPVLRKDFMIDPYQIIESRVIGADCILLIMAALSNSQAVELESAAHELGMDVLIEVHNEQEMERALTHLRSSLLGINNRNLKTLKVDLAVTETLRDMIPTGYHVVSESGIVNYKDIERMNAVGVLVFLVGESLMLQEDVAKATRLLLGNE
jgi:indole-3-glycerol phosphate synthase